MSVQTGSHFDEAFRYDQCPLENSEEIRILTLLEHGGRPGNPIECTLSTLILSTGLDRYKDRYEALSYSWGTGEIDRQIKICVGSSKPYTFGVRSNLFAALKQLRLYDEPWRLWIDAICIDQDNHEEKNAQVPKMPQIYNGAQNVCVWLGEEVGDQCSWLAFNFIKRALNLDDFDHLVISSRYPQEWQALASLMTKPWFSRRWVIQEIALAKRATIYCGPNQITWSEFTEAVSLFEEVKPQSQLITNSNSIMQPDSLIYLNDFLYEIPQLAATQLVRATLDVFRKTENGLIMEKNFPLEVLISDFSAFKVTRPHDVIYAVLALAKGVNSRQKRTANSNSTSVQSSPVMTERDTERPMMLNKLATEFVQRVTEKAYYVDYEKDFVDVCKEFLFHTIDTGKSFDIICRPWVPEDNEDVTASAKPSWLLTTSHTAFRIQSDGSYVRANADTLVGRPDQGKRTYNACAMTKVLGFEFGGGQKRLSLFVDGFIIDVVGELQPWAKDGKIPREWLVAGQWPDQSTNPPERFWRTLVGSRGPDGSNCPGFYPRACTCLKPQIPGGNISTMELLLPSRQPSTMITKFLRRVQEVIWMRRLFTTRRNLLGLALQKSEKGDLICILYGCSVPVILRRHDAIPSDVYYEFIGECYVHDLMDGEAFAIRRRGLQTAEGNHEDPKRRNFEIR